MRLLHLTFPLFVARFLPSVSHIAILVTAFNSIQTTSAIFIFLSWHLFAFYLFFAFIYSTILLSFV